MKNKQHNNNETEWISGKHSARITWKSTKKDNKEQHNKCSEKKILRRIIHMPVSIRFLLKFSIHPQAIYLLHTHNKLAHTHILYSQSVSHAHTQLTIILAYLAALRHFIASNFSSVLLTCAHNSDTTTGEPSSKWAAHERAQSKKERISPILSRQPCCRRYQ